MDKLIIRGEQDSPDFLFDADSGKLEISGISMPEDVNQTYKPAIDWLNEYKANPNKETEIIIKLEYYNSSSSKRIAQILLVLQEIYNQSHDVKITWFVEDDDERMEVKGGELLSLVNLPYEFKMY